MHPYNHTIARLNSLMKLYFPYQYDNFQYGKNTVELNGKLIALYDWTEEDVPYFFFNEIQKEHYYTSEYDYLNRKQNLFLPFLKKGERDQKGTTAFNNHLIAFLESLPYTVQEIRKKLSYNDALDLKFCQTNNLEINQTLKYKIEDQFRKIADKSYGLTLFNNWDDNLKKHLAFSCLIES